MWKDWDELLTVWTHFVQIAESSLRRGGMSTVRDRSHVFGLGVEVSRHWALEKGLLLAVVSSEEQRRAEVMSKHTNLSRARQSRGGERLETHLFCLWSKLLRPSTPLTSAAHSVPDYKTTATILNTRSSFPCCPPQRWCWLTIGASFYVGLKSPNLLRKLFFSQLSHEHKVASIAQPLHSNSGV